MEEIIHATEVITNGGVILHLTDTIWGLACDPKNEAAVDRILQIKNRPKGKSFIVLILNGFSNTRKVDILIL